MHSIEDASSDLWHTHLYHLSEKGLNILAKNNFFRVKDTPLKTCTQCFSSKKHGVFFNNNSSHKRPSILDLVHINVCMMDGKSLGAASYFVTFIDDHSRKKSGLFVLKSKYQVKMKNIRRAG